jgi:hypothetical protein
MANGKVDERPQLTLDSRTSHRGEGSREGVGPESSCSTARSIIRTLRAVDGYEHDHPSHSPVRPHVPSRAPPDPC